MLLPAASKVAAYMSTYKDFPPRQRPSSFSIDQIMEKVNASLKGK
jgi:arylsulfatase